MRASSEVRKEKKRKQRCRNAILKSKLKISKNQATIEIPVRQVYKQQTVIFYILSTL